MTVELKGNNSSIPVEWITFPAGERHCVIQNVEDIQKLYYADRIAWTITCNFKSSDDIIDICLLNNAIRNIVTHQHPEVELFIRYFPYARQDRCTASGTAFSLQVISDILKTCNFSKITTYDIHSDVLAGMLPEGKFKNIPQHELIGTMLNLDLNKKNALIAPDAGALKKIYSLATNFNLPVIVASKKRDSATGNITGTAIDIDECLLYDVLYVVDDLIDGGRTYIELAKIIRTQFKGTLVLLATHGIFSKGKKELFQYFDRVDCFNDMSKGNENV